MHITLYFLDEPDSHLHQSSINEITDIIKKSLVEGLGFQVFLTTHNDRTVSYLENKDDEYIRCFIMDNEDGSVQIQRYKKSLSSKLLLDHHYIMIVKDKGMNIHAFEQLISCMPEYTKNDYAMEQLIKLHTEFRTPGCLRFLEMITASSNLDKYHVEVIVNKNLHSHEKLLDTFKNAINSGIRVVWPTDPNNPSFDVLVFSQEKNLVVFCQITVREDYNLKLGQMFEEKKFEKYKIFLNKLEENFVVKYILIHGNNEKGGGIKVKQKLMKKTIDDLDKIGSDDENVVDESITYKNMNEKEIEIELYCLQELGGKEIFDSEPMVKIDEIKKKITTKRTK